MTEKRNNIQSWLDTLAEDKFHVRILLDWDSTESYPKELDGILETVGEDFLALDRPIEDFEKEKYVPGIDRVMVTVPLGRVVQVISFFSTLDK